jgi:hypothetical protein
MTESILNQQVADRFREAAQLLELQQANPFRVMAYRRAADTVAALAEDVKALFERAGTEGLEELPRIGPSLAAAIAEMLRTGRWMQLERMRGAADPEKLFQTIPGVGPGLAARIHETLHVDTLAALEAAGHDGRLETVPGVGRRRAAALRAALANMLSRTRPRRLRSPTEPAVELLLDVDREYREKAAANQLPMIAPKRFNPEGKAWLPVLHAERGPWHFTVLFSNTARAHELDRIHDWVVIYFHTDTEPEGQRTIVTESRGELVGKRVVRGRESDCRAHYQVGSSSSLAMATREAPATARG